LDTTLANAALGAKLDAMGVYVTRTEIIALRGTERLKRGCVLASRTNSGVHRRWRERFSNGKSVN